MVCLNYLYDYFKNLIYSEKSYFCQKKTSSFDAYYVDECNMKNGDDYEDNEYDFIDEYDLGNEDDINDADILSAFIDEYGADDEEYDSGISSEEEDEAEYPPAKTLNKSWGFVDSGDLSIEFKETTIASKHSRKAIDFSLLILAQAKKDFFKKLASEPKQNLSRQNGVMARLSPKPKQNFSA